MKLIDISFSDPIDNLLYDDVLLDLAEKGHEGECLRLWESPSYFVVLGRIGKETEDVRLDLCKKENIPVLRRSSGGGTVLQGPGCFNYSVVLSKTKNSQLNDLKKSYQIILEKVCGALSMVGVKAEFRPISDLIMMPGERKFSGNAQKRGRNYILHHGTILYKFELNLIEHYLRMPKEIPEYRKNRGHLDFVTNIKVPKEELKIKLSENFGTSTVQTVLTPIERSCLGQFRSDKKIVIV